MPVYSIMSKRQAVIKSENRDLFKRQKTGAWQSSQADKGGDAGSEKANSSLEDETDRQAGKGTPRKTGLQRAHSNIMEPQLYTAVISIHINGLNSPIYSNLTPESHNVKLHQGKHPTTCHS